MVKKQWNPTETARSCIDDMDSSIKTCNAEALAHFAACIYGNSEAAFYRKEAYHMPDGIDEDTMEEMKEEATRHIAEFVRKCKCNKR